MRAPIQREYTYQVRRAARRWPLRMDETVYVAGHQLPRHLHPRPVLIAFLEGGWLHSVGDETRRIGPGEIAFLPAHTAHALTFAGRFGRAFSIEFEESPARDTLPRRPLHTSDPRLLALTLDAYRSFASDRATTGQRLAAELTITLDSVDRRQNKFGSSHDTSWLGITLDRVRTSVADGVRMSAIAREVGINPAHMSRRFHQVFGESMSAFRDRLRVEHASRALLNSADTISAIAAQLGFCDHAHLTRTFKRATRMTPSQFRRVVADTCLGQDQIQSRDGFVNHPPSVSGIRVF
jgi:AraC family transcriptional regulator